MAYLRQKLLERLRTIGVLTTISITVVVGVRQASANAVQVPASFADDDISARTSRRRLKMDVLRHQIETLTLALRRCSSEKICPPLLFTTINTSGAEPDAITPAR